MTQWDHRVLTFGANGTHRLDDMEAVLVDKGGEGWEVVAAFGENPTTVILKAPRAFIVNTLPAAPTGFSRTGEPTYDPVPLVDHSLTAGELASHSMAVTETSHDHRPAPRARGYAHPTKPAPTKPPKKPKSAA